MQFQKYLTNSLSYNDYLDLTKKLVEQNKTSGAEQREDWVAYTKLNLQRMQRIGKTTTLLPELLETLRVLDSPQVWLLITETWCGDAAQNLPILNLIAGESSHISLRIVLRDENADLMDRYLTNGSRSIPKLISFDPKNNDELFVWGPRPLGAQNLAMELKRAGLDSATKSLAVQKWYLADKGINLQREIHALLTKTPKLKESEQ